MKNSRKYILNIISASLMISGIAAIPSFAVSAFLKETSVVMALGPIILITALTGFIGVIKLGEVTSQVKTRVQYLTLVVVWFMLIGISALAFYFGRPGSGIADSVFEASAIWTTTGISAFDISTVPMGLQLYRASCNWLGGIGIIMVCLSLLPSRKYMGWTMAALEYPGPAFMKGDNDFRRYYKRIVALYAALSLIQFALLLVAGMSPYSALLTSLSNTATAGLHHINNGVVTALSMPVKIVITLFAFICSLNIAVIFYALHRKWNKIRENSEFKVYVSHIILAAALITLLIKMHKPGAGLAGIAVSSLMQVISSFSTAGFVVAEVWNWPLICVIIMLLQLFIGSCALSSGGGFKVARFVIAVKSSFYSLYKLVHPNSVRTLTLNKKPLKSESVTSANLFIALFMMTYLIGALLLTIEDINIADALNYSQAMITNSGISLGSLAHAGSAETFGSYSKLVMSLIMLAGRLEIYPLLTLFFSDFWKSDSTL